MIPTIVSVILCVCVRVYETHHLTNSKSNLTNCSAALLAILHLLNII